MKDNKTFKGAVIISGLILILYMIFSDKYDYEILKESEMRNEKKELDIGLNSKLSKDKLDEITKELEREFNNFERIYVWFHLGNDLNRKPWAVANYSNKDWNTTVTSTIEVEEKLKNINLNYDILGKWFEESANTASSIIFYKKGEKTYKLSTYHDFSNSTSELKTKDNITYKYIESFHGEFFKIEANGNLGFYNKENRKFIEAVKY